MKNSIKQMLTLAAVLLSGSCLTSCDEDTSIAFRLQGEWFGDFGMYYYYRFPCCEVRYDTHDTHLKFDNEFIGTSWLYVYQVDYYDNTPINQYGQVDYHNGHVSPFEYIYHRAECHVKNRELRFRYKGEREWDTNIYDYSLNSRYFEGVFDNGAPFSMRNDNWPYWERYCIVGHDYNYWSRAEKAELQVTPRKDKFLLCPREDGVVLIDREENPTTIVKLREGVDPNSVDLTHLRFGNRYQDEAK
ncbi:MAG: hypothetical protein KBT12_05545 [Bacteroidales bacterium]|nr:hypothetical protein [Candidatus Physcousia equi]